MCKAVVWKCCAVALMTLLLAGCAQKQGTLSVYQSGKVVDQRTVYWQSGTSPYFVMEDGSILFTTSDPMDLPPNNTCYVGTGGTFLLEEK